MGEDGRKTSAEGEYRPFRIGLCMAGAVSAGAYTAGVVDFLLEALDAWQRRKDAESGMEGGKRTVLAHETILSCMSGASAGGMTAAAIAAALCGDYRPMSGLSFGDTPGNGNIPYRCWVESVSIEDFLGLKDLEREPVVRSLLDCTRLDEIAEASMKPDGTIARPRAYIDPEFDMYLSLANLRGTPYAITFKGEGNYRHEMTLHKDHIRFRLSRTDAEPGSPSGHFLQRVPAMAGVFGDAVYWQMLKDAALATGAFPLALRPRVLRRDQDEYRQRKWVVPHPLACPERCREKGVEEPELFDGPVFGLKEQWLKEFFDAGRLAIDEPEAFDTLNVDGGAFDNEPLELARQHLACGEVMNPRSPEEACRAVVLIDPFPDGPGEDRGAVGHDADVLAVAGKILDAMKANARFKQDELLLAQDENCYSRFLIGPSRGKDVSGATKKTIACGGLGGFGGFFSRKFRQHDYLLGRRNCQRFLSHHFVIPLKAAQVNPVFARDREHLERFSYDVDGVRVVPLIPLLDEASRPVALPPWDLVMIHPAEIAHLRALILARLKRVADIYLARYAPGFKGWLAKTFFLNGEMEKLADVLVRIIHDSFKDCGVMRQ